MQPDTSEEYKSERNVRRTAKDVIKADCEITSWPCVKHKVHNPQVSCQTNGEHVSQQHSNTANFMDAEMEDKWLMTITLKEDEARAADRTELEANQASLPLDIPYSLLGQSFTCTRVCMPLEGLWPHITR